MIIKTKYLSIHIIGKDPWCMKKDEVTRSVKCLLWLLCKRYCWVWEYILPTFWKLSSWTNDWYLEFGEYILSSFMFGKNLLMVCMVLGHCVRHIQSSFVPLVLTKQWALNGWKEKLWDSNTRCMFNADTHGRVMVLQLLFGGWDASHGQFRPQQKVTKWSFRQHCRQRPHEEWPGNWEKGLAPELMSKHQNAIRRLVWYS